MPTLRSGLLLATLLLSACSMPILQDSPSSKVDNRDTNTVQPNALDTPSVNTSAAEELTPTNTTTAPTENSSTNKTLMKQLADQTALAQSNHTELTNRLGKAPGLPKVSPSQSRTDKELNASIQALRTYVSQTNTTLATLNARVSDRQKVAMNGDVIRIFLSEVTVEHNAVSFKAQPLVGQWVRGESRGIRLKDNILFENPKSEDLNITFSETYQLVVNNQVIATINPNREKNDANFNVATHDKTGSIKGKLDYRIVDDK